MPLSKIDSDSLSAPLTVPAGSAADPAITTTGDSNTGIFFPAADTIAFAEGGAEVARFDSAGSLLVGQTTSATTLRGVTINATQQGVISRNGLSEYNELGVWAGTSDTVKAQVQANQAGKVLIGSRTNHDLVFTISDTEKARIDTSGNVGIGTSSPAAKFETFNSAVNAAFVANTPSTWRVAQIRNDQSGTNGSASGIAFVGHTSTQPAGIVAINGNTTGGIVSLGFLTVSGNTTAEAMRIHSSGNMSVGTTGDDVGRLYVRVNSTTLPVVQLQNEAASGQMMTFRTNGNSQVGSISFGISTVAYNTSSDYRLKESIAPMTGALAKVALLKPCTYKWKVDGSNGQGFIAHELDEVVPGCVTGEKDAVDADGKPQYQGIDTSFLVATLTAAIQELKAIVDAQGAEIAALKGTP